MSWRKGTLQKQVQRLLAEYEWMGGGIRMRLEE